MKEKYTKQIDKLKDKMKQMKDDCDAKIKAVKDQCDAKKPKETSPRSKSYVEYTKKINEGSPLSFGGGNKTTAHRRYRNVEYHKQGNGHHTIRRVHIVGGKGHKSVTTQMGKTRRVAKKALTKDEIEKICDRKFIPGLFDDCMTKPAK